MGIRHENLERFYQLLHARGEDTTTLAAAVCTSRAYVSRVITGYERRGTTWERIRRLLTEEEVALLESIPLQGKAPQMTAVRRASQARALVARYEGGPAQPINTAAPMVRRFNQWRQEKATA